MSSLWLVLLVAFTGSHFIHGLPLFQTPNYPQDVNGRVTTEEWKGDSTWYVAVPALALVITAVGLLFGCTWCIRHKDCKQNQGTDNQLFTGAALEARDGRRSQPDSGFSEPAADGARADNNNGPISLRDLQNIANNNAAAYVASAAEARPEPVEPAPPPAHDPLERCADWFGAEEFPRSRLQYLREIGRGWFGRLVEAELDAPPHSRRVVAKIVRADAAAAERARVLAAARLYRDAAHERVLRLHATLLADEPWILVFEHCDMTLQQYLLQHRPQSAELSAAGVPLRLQCDVAAALAHLHALGWVYGDLHTGSVLVRGAGAAARGVLGAYGDSAAERTHARRPERMSSDVHALGTLLWQTSAWGAAPAAAPPEPAPPGPHRAHLYQVMQLCWRPAAERPSAAQVHALLEHLLGSLEAGDRGAFERRWETLKPNTIAKVDEHVAIVHAPSASAAERFTGSEGESQSIQLSVDLDATVSRSSSLLSDKELGKSASLTNLHGSLEDVRNIYLTHNEPPAQECHQANVGRCQDAAVDPWLKEILAGSQDDVSYYKDVSDVIKNLDNILNSEKTSSSESSHQASPSRDNLSLDCKRECAVPSSLVKSPGISNFQNILDDGFDAEEDAREEDGERDTVGSLSHSFERHSDTTSQHTLENVTPNTPMDICEIESRFTEAIEEKMIVENNVPTPQEVSEVPMLKELCLESTRLSETFEVNVKDCQTSCDINKPSTDTQTISSKSNCVTFSENGVGDKPDEGLGDIIVEQDNSENVLAIVPDEDLNKEDNEPAEVVEETEAENTVTDSKVCETVNEVITFESNNDNQVYVNASTPEPVASDKNDREEIEECESLPIEPDDINEIATHVQLNGHDINPETNEGIVEAINLFLTSPSESVAAETVSNVEITLDAALTEHPDDEVQNETLLHKDSTNVTNEKEDNEVLPPNETVMFDQSTAYMDLKDEPNENNLNVSEILTYEQQQTATSTDESTIYMDLPNAIVATHQLLAAERAHGSGEPAFSGAVTASTPKGSDRTEPSDAAQSHSQDMQCRPHSPFESPTRSHPTDTYDENSSVVLGPFESCDRLRSAHADADREELLAFSSNFSEMNLATPSPLRDANFLNEVPEPEFHLDNLAELEPPGDVMDGVGRAPLTPPNSPGSLPSTAHKYIVDIDLETPAESDSGVGSLQKEIELNHIELQMTSKLAQAENENNMNIECAGPPEGVPEAVLAGCGGAPCDADSVEALRTELELKLPIAQSMSIEPPPESAWSPTALVVSYPGALSPIAEETGHQLSAYENDRHWSAHRTDSSESYPEPCNNSTDEVTDLPAADRTYSVTHDPVTHDPVTHDPVTHDPVAHGAVGHDNDTYTVQGQPTSSNNITMSVDSLNVASVNRESDARRNDRTFTKEECERLSQVSPCLLSPATDTAAEHPTAPSTLSRTTAPTDAKASKPSEAGLSKATSIDSWCSNDTLFNVEDNFDDLVADDGGLEYDRDDSASTDTLHDRPDDNHTYVVNDSRSDCDTFSPDSISEHCTYTKPRTPALVLPADRDSGKTPTADLAYGTLPSDCTYTNCSTQVLSDREDLWMIQQPELVRRSPVGDEANVTPPVAPGKLSLVHDSPRVTVEPLGRMDSVDMTCLQDHSDAPANEVSESDNYFRDMAHSVQSTPLNPVDDGGDCEPIPMVLPEIRCDQSPESFLGVSQSFQAFVNSAELRPQDMSPNQDTGLLLEGESRSLSGHAKDDRTPTYSDFEDSAVCKPQDLLNSNSNSNVNASEDFHVFENSARSRPQDLSSIEASMSLLRSEALHTAVTANTLPNSSADVSENNTDSAVPIYHHNPSYVENEVDEDQPHSIIITENEITEAHDSKDYANCTYDSHPHVNMEYNSEIHAADDASRDKDDKKPLSILEAIWSAPASSASGNVESNSLPNGSHHETENTDNVDDEAEEDSKESEPEVMENNVDINENSESESTKEFMSPVETDMAARNGEGTAANDHGQQNGGVELTAVTESFLDQEKKFCDMDSFLPMLEDIRFTGPASDVMSTSFTDRSPTAPAPAPAAPAPNGCADAPPREWDSDSDQSDNSSGEFIWKGGDGRAATVLPSWRFGHQQPPPPAPPAPGSESSGSDEVEFVPSSWDARREPAKSSLRSLEPPAAPQDKKRVVFKRQKYHCVYEYPRECADRGSPAQLPDYSTYADWAAAAAEEAELSYSQLYGGLPFDMMPAAGAFGADYDEDFFISSSAHPFASLGPAPAGSQFFPGALGKRPPPPGDLPAPAPPAPPADLTTPDSGVEDVTPGDDPPPGPGSPGALGGLRHTRDRLKLDLPPSPLLAPHLPSPRLARVFNFVLDKPKRGADTPPPLVMTDDTPLAGPALPLEPPPAPEPEPTFSTFGKSEGGGGRGGGGAGARGEGTLLDSGDEDSGIESSKASLGRRVV